MSSRPEEIAAVQARLAQLTEREREVLTLVADGLSNVEIARRLGRTGKTVESHLANLRRKLEIRDRVSLARIASTMNDAGAPEAGSISRSPAERRRVTRGANLAVREEIGRGEMASAALRGIDAAVSTVVGLECLRALTAAFGSALRLRAAAIFEFKGDDSERRLHAVAASADGAEIEVASIASSESVLAALLAKDFLSLEDAHADPMVRALGAASDDARPLLAGTLRDRSGTAIGALALVGDGRFDIRLEPELLLRSQLARAAAELERLRDDTRTRMVVDGAVDMISVHTPSGAYAYASPSCEALLGYRAEELVGHSAYDFVDSADIATVGQVHHEVLTEADQVRVRFVLRRKDGHRIWVESQTQAVRGRDGEITDLVVITRDITNQHRAQESLAAARSALESRVERQEEQIAMLERRWRDIGAAIEDYLVIVDRDLRIIYINRTLPDTTIDQVIGTTPDLHLDPEHDHALELAAAVIRTGKPQRTEFETVSPAGRVRWAASITPLIDGGSVSGAICVARDMRGVREAELALLESERRYRMLFEDSPEGLLVHDGERVRMANHRVAELLGYADPAKLIGVPMINLVEPEFRPLVRKRVSSLLSGAASQPRMRQRLLRLDGSTIELEVAARACLYEGRPAVQTSMRPIEERVETSATTRLEA